MLHTFPRNNYNVFANKAKGFTSQKLATEVGMFVTEFGVIDIIGAVMFCAECFCSWSKLKKSKINFVESSSHELECGYNDGDSISFMISV